MYLYILCYTVFKELSTCYKSFKIKAYVWRPSSSFLSDLMSDQYTKLLYICNAHFFFLPCSVSLFKRLRTLKGRSDNNQYSVTVLFILFPEERSYILLLINLFFS